MTLILVLGEFRSGTPALLNWGGHGCWRWIARLALNNWKALKEHFGTAWQRQAGRTCRRGW